MDIAVRQGAGYLSSLGPVLRRQVMEKGFLLRPRGTVVYILPPCCIRRDELAAVYTSIQEVVSRNGCH